MKVTLPHYRFPKSNFDIKTFLSCLKYSFETTTFISSAKNLAASNIPRYSQLSRSCNDLTTLLSCTSAPTVYKILPFFFPNKANFSLVNPISMSLLKTQTFWTNESNSFLQSRENTHNIILHVSVLLTFKKFMTTFYGSGSTVSRYKETVEF